jgi:MoaA/NifB/PqqE/SkfB family radical SAM enzyme
MKRGCKGAFKTALTAIENAKQAGLYVMLQTVVDKEFT